MPNVPTPILGLTVPTIGGDNNLWGNELNTDLAIIDNLGAAPLVNASSNFTAGIPVFPEQVIRVTTGGLTITGQLPAPGSVPGKIYLVKKVDTGIGTVTVVAVGGALIDGQANYLITNAFQYVRLFSNGSSYDVIGNN